MMDDSERELFADSLRRATEAHTGDELDRALDELGWRDALSDDRQAAVSLLFELQGSANTTSSGLDGVMAHALGAPGGTATAVVLPPVGAWHPPGALDGGRLTITGTATAGLVNRGQAAVVASTPDGDAMFLVATDRLGVRPVRGLDPWLGLVEVSGGVADPRPAAPSCDWPSAVALARLALSHELIGAARRMLALAREHALGRVQFGRPISGFQAVRHRLAETLVAIEAADAVAVAAWGDMSAQGAAMAKGVAGRGARTAARHSQQVLAGIGFTTEHPLHRYVRRVLVVDQLFGASRTLTRELGADLLRTRRLPPLLPL